MSKLFINVNMFHSFRSENKPAKDEIRVREFKTLVKLLKQRSKWTFPQFMFSSVGFLKNEPLVHISRKISTPEERKRSIADRLQISSKSVIEEEIIYFVFKFLHSSTHWILWGFSHWEHFFSFLCYWTCTNVSSFVSFMIQINKAI